MVGTGGTKSRRLHDYRPRAVVALGQYVRGKGRFPGPVLTVSINGKKYELEAAGGSRLRLGDYKAKVEKDNSPRPYEYDRAYEFLFADGSTRKYWVVGEEE